MQEAGWYVRCDIIWSKPNPMPESVKDRPTKAHEYIYLLSKSARYYYDSEAIAEPGKNQIDDVRRLSQISIKHKSIPDDKKNGLRQRVPTGWDTGPGGHTGKQGRYDNSGYDDRWYKNIHKKDKQRGHSRKHAGFNERWDQMTYKEQCSLGRNKRSVWEIATQPFPEAHFATFPVKLAKTCIAAGCPQSGVVYDPYGGAGTTAVAALELDRHFVLSEIN